MYCNNCGGEIKDGDEFCPICGEKVAAKVNKKEYGHVRKKIVKTSEKKKRMFIPLFVLIAVALIYCFVTFFIGVNPFIVFSDGKKIEFYFKSFKLVEEKNYDDDGELYEELFFRDNGNLKNANVYKSENVVLKQKYNKKGQIVKEEILEKEVKTKEILQDYDGEDLIAVTVISYAKYAIKEDATIKEVQKDEYNAGVLVGSILCYENGDMQIVKLNVSAEDAFEGYSFESAEELSSEYFHHSSFTEDSYTDYEKECIQGVIKDKQVIDVHYELYGDVIMVAFYEKNRPLIAIQRNVSDGSKLINYYDEDGNISKSEKE